MKQVGILLALTISAILSLCEAKEFTIGGINYKTLSGNTVACKANDKKATFRMTVPQTVLYNGINYAVTEVAKKGFADMPNLVEVTLPNSIVKIGEGAFHNCPKLLKAQLPDNAVADITQGDFGFGRYGIFKGCTSLNDVRGINVPYPPYVVYDVIYDCDEVPFAQTVRIIGQDKLIAMKSAEEGNATAQPMVAEVDTKVTDTPDVVDTDVPLGQPGNDRTFAIVIGNENYKYLENVEHAQNDAEIFARYCNKTLGIPERNIKEYKDATLGDLYVAVNDLRNISRALRGNIKVIFYYAGHGAPEEVSRDAYIIPCDAPGLVTPACYPLKKLYDDLASIESESVVAFMDACFSGSVRGDGMLTKARGVKLRPKTERPSGKVVVFAAAAEDQTAFPYREKRHGLFSYVLLEKMHSTVGNVSLGELADYLREEVAEKSITVNGKPQTPTVLFSPDLQDTWRNMPLR